MTPGVRFAALARRYGQQVTVCSREGDSASGYGFLQPFLSEQKDYLWQAASRLGSFDGARFRFLGEAGLGESREDFHALTCRGVRYRFREVEPYYLGEELAYWWGVLTYADKEESP